MDVRQDFYSLLEINKSASQEEIKEAYKKAVLKYHPDKNADSGPVFERVQAAYKVLSGPETRRIYDQYGEEGIQEKFLEIDLAYRTMCYLEKLNERQEQDAKDLRSLLVNLCDLQYFFARPLYLPFGIGHDYLDVLQMPRPLAFLERAKAIFKLDQEEEHLTDFQGSIKPDNEGVYIIAGHERWKKLVSENKLTGLDAEDPAISKYQWLQKLFEFLSVVRDFPLGDDLRKEAQRLVPCWMHVATQIHFSEKEGSDKEEKATAMVTELVGGVVGGLAAILGDEGDEDDEDDEYKGEDEDDDEDGDGDGDGEGDGEGDENADEDEKEAAEEASRKRKLAEILAEESRPAKKARTDEDESSDEDFKESESSSASDDEAEIEEEEEESMEEIEEKQKIAQSIFRVAEDLNMYMPDPEKDMFWFKRVLKDVRMVQIHESPFWYPWGCPPLGEDPYPKEVAVAILKLYRSAAPSEEKSDNIEEKA